MVTTTTQTTTRTAALAVSPDGAIIHAPEHLTVSAPTLRAWTRNRLAIRHCPGACPAANPWDSRCGGHPDPDIRPGHRIVLGRPAAGPRAVYTVTATGTAGTLLEREA